MNECTKYLIENAIEDTKNKLLEDIKALRNAHTSYNNNLYRLQMYAETLSCSETDTINILGLSINDIEEYKQRAISGDVSAEFELRRLARKRMDEQEKVKLD